MRLLHPITLAVILVGVAGFLLGLIIAVERQDVVVDAPVAVPRIDVEMVNRVARLESELASRESEFAGVQAELAKLRAAAPTAAAIADAESRIADLETALANSSTEMTTLRSEVTELSGLLAAAIQARDEFSAQIERTRADGENERTNFEQTITGLRRQLVSSENERTSVEQAIADLRRQVASGENERTGFEQSIADLRRQLEVANARPTEPVVAASDGATPDEAPGETEPSAASQVSAAKPADTATSASAEPAQPPAEVAAPATTPAEPSQPDQQTATVAPVLGPISQGVAAYRAAEYRKAYELWLPRALQGSSRAQFFVGALYFEGRGVPADRVMSYM